MKKQSYLKDLLTVGFALFAMFFGAGNLIFPPHLGLYCGGQWWLGFLIYFLADVGLGFLAVLALVKLDGRVDMVAEPLGRGPSVALSTAVISVLGPLLVIPRTAATTYELGVIPLFGIESSRVSLVILSVVFYAIVILLTIRPGKVVDIVGKILTPILLVSLLVLIIKGAVDPEAAVGPVLTESVFQEGLYNGYQTMDMLGAMFLIVVVLLSVKGKGYQGKGISRMTVLAMSVSSVLLFLVYGGLTYLGAVTGPKWMDDVVSGNMNQAGLLIAVTRKILGTAGTTVLSIVVSSACLTTAIGVTSSAAEYFENLFKEKISYKKWVVIISIISAVICNLGLSQIISVTAPVLMFLYPITIIMIISALDTNRMDNRVVAYRAATIVAMIISIIDVLGSTFGLESFAAFNAKLPLAEFGFSWLLPSLLTFAILAPIRKPKKKSA